METRFWTISIDRYHARIETLFMEFGFTPLEDFLCKVKKFWPLTAARLGDQFEAMMNAYFKAKKELEPEEYYKQQAKKLLVEFSKMRDKLKERGLG